MRKPLIAGNWKMNTTCVEAVTLVKTMLPEMAYYPAVEIVLCPPFISLNLVADLIKNSKIKLGAQNMYYADRGAFTGEISPVMLAEICQYVIIGHSERRHIFGESNDLICRKVKSSIEYNLKPILCVGENIDQYESGKTEKVVTEQLRASLKGVENIETLTVAYEPVWAIGTGKAATAGEANETITIIRNEIAKMYKKELAENIRILYGGSVTSQNIGEFVSQPQIDGGLVGGASIKIDEFVGIIKKTSELV